MHIDEFSNRFKEALEGSGIVLGNIKSDSLFEYFLQVASSYIKVDPVKWIYTVSYGKDNCNFDQVSKQIDDNIREFRKVLNDNFCNF